MLEDRFSSVIVASPQTVDQLVWVGSRDRSFGTIIVQVSPIWTISVAVGRAVAFCHVFVLQSVTRMKETGVTRSVNPVLIWLTV